MGYAEEDLFQRLKEYQASGVEFLQLDSQSCQLKYPLDLLEIDRIRSGIPEIILSQLSSIERHTVLDSTNSALLNLPAEEQHARVYLAEYQTAGRGRFGRQWVAPFASGLCLSLGWQFQKNIDQFQLISLLPAVAVIRTMHKIGLDEARVKWPNDVICRGHKLAGMLIEISAKNPGVQGVVIGVGLNVYNRTEMSAQIQQPWTAIDQQLDSLPARSELAAQLITELLRLIQTIEQGGLTEIRNEWQCYDALKNRSVTLINGKQKQKGISRGISEDGSLCVEINGQLKQFVSGEITLRSDEQNTTR